MAERIGLMFLLLLTPSLEVATSAEQRGAEDFEVVKLGFLLAAYRAENGRYPIQLSDLIPKYTAEVPLDRCSGKPLIYKPQENGYVLYSVGENGKDDGGLGYEDRGQSAGGVKEYDDLVVQVPLKKRVAQAK